MRAGCGLSFARCDAVFLLFQLLSVVLTIVYHLLEGFVVQQATAVAVVVVRADQDAVFDAARLTLGVMNVIRPARMTTCVPLVRVGR